MCKEPVESSESMPRSPHDQPEGPRCPECGGALRFSHVEYAGRGLEAAVRRCEACGAISRGAPQLKRQRSGAERAAQRKRAPIDEGPPSNPVLDPELARRLLE